MPSRRTLVAFGATAAIVAAVATERKWKSADDPVLPDHLKLPDGKPLAVHTDDGAVIAATVAGEGPTVVLAHGYTNGRAVWSPVAHRLVESGHRVVLYDQRGHGESTVGADGYTVARLGSDLRAVLEAADARDAVLVGHSMGGMTIQAFAAAHPGVLAERVKGVVLVSTTSHGLADPRLRRTAPAVLGSARVDRVLRAPGGHAFMRGVVGRNVRKGHLTLARDLFIATPPETRVGFFNAMQEMDLREGLAGLTVPATVLVGTRDRLTPRPMGQALADALGVELVTFPDAGHMLPLEHPDEVAEIIRDHALSSRSSGEGNRVATTTPPSQSSN
jgi:non-heme chloroperoxidase